MNNQIDRHLARLRSISHHDGSDSESPAALEPGSAATIYKSIYVRNAKISDLDTIMDIFQYAKQRMRKSGNNTQWTNGYPSDNVVTKDIDDGNGYVIESDRGILGVFTFIIGEDPYYSNIEGEWPDNKPYGTIHRIASALGAKGVADIALDFCLKHGVNIRIDTHADNSPMLGWIAKRGFKYCGIIHVHDGTPRKAFQLQHC